MFWSKRQAAVLSLVVMMGGLHLSARGAAQHFGFSVNGKLTDVQGNPLSGTQRITFTVYAQPEDGEPLWTETQNVRVGADGSYQVRLGGIFKDGKHAYLFTGSPQSFENADALWVEAQVRGPRGQSFQVQSPRVQTQPVQPPSVPVAMNLFGTHIVNLSLWPTVPVGALGKSGETFSDIEQTQGVYNWSRLDQALADAQANGIGKYFSNVYIPPWAAADPSTCSPDPSNASQVRCTSTVSNMQYWDDFVTAMVTRYKGRLNYELWNEPDQPTEFSGTIAQMVALTQDMYNIIRANDPAALIISPSYTGSSNLDAYFAGGGPTGVDVISIHGYPDAAVNDVPETIGGFKTVPIRAVMLKYGLTQPMWDTESSWGKEPPAIADPDLRAAYISRSYMLHWSNAVQRFYWFEWDASNYGTLWSPLTGLSEAGTALATVQKWMLGATMPNACSMNGGTLYSAVYTCDFIQANGAQVRAVWYTNGNTTYTAPSQYTHYQDLLGNTYNIPSNQTVNIGYKPILLQP